VARRKELKNIASGLYGSFISRNNDVAGYWGMGKLCLLAEQQKTNTVRLDLIAQSISPQSTAFSKLVAGYLGKLQKHLESRNISRAWVASAVIELDFKPSCPVGKHIPVATWGSLFKLTVSIKDDKGKDHAIEGYGYCGPHNSRKESKSAGEDRF
jgi:hypothetical protein